MKKKRISIIGVRAYPSDFEGTSGVEVYVQNVVDHLLKNRAVSFLLYTKSPYQHRTTKINYSVKIKSLFSVNSKVFESVWYSLIASLLSCSDGSETVWYQGPGMAVFAWLPKLFGKKVVVTIHGFDWERKKWNSVEKKIFFLIVRFVIFLKPTFISVSETMQSRFKKQFNIESIIALPGLTPCFLNTKKIARTLHSYKLKKKQYLIYVGRIVPEKRIDWILNAFIQTKTDDNDLKILLVGSHGNMKTYEQKLKKKYFQKSIIWTGHVSNEEKTILLSQANGFVFASEVEGGNPLSLLEAIAFRLPCLVPTESVTASFKSIDNVVFFNKNDYCSFRKKFCTVLKGNKTKRSHSLSERKFLEQYDWNKTSNLYATTL